MATGSHTLQQHALSLETRIKTLINNDLKEICKAYNYQVSGTKAVLQKRCIEILTDIVKRSDQAGYDELNYRVAHHGQIPPQSLQGRIPTAASGQKSTPGYNTHTSMARSTGHHGPSGGKYFKPSPFYDVQDTIVPLNDLPGYSEMPQNRHTVKVTLTLLPDQVARLKADANVRLLLYCGASQGMHVYQPVDVAFPNQLEVKINGDDVRANFKGLKNKPGSTKPADITDKVRKTNNYPNQLSVTYALTNKRYAFVVHMVNRITVDALTERIKTGKHGGGIISKQSVMDEMNKANADPDIAATSIRMSLKDPISTLRITLPVRSSVCTHNQCFDGAMFMQLQDQAPQWTCPVCNKSVSYESLCVDKYFQEILEKTPSSIDKVDIEPNGRWQIIKEEEELKPAGHSSRGRASYDDDFDDDLVEVDALPKGPNGLVASLSTTSLLSPATNGGFAMNTPPLSSRGVSAAPSHASTQPSNKRPASSVIDLTLSDDEDEPPRSAKRQSTSTHQGNSTHYSTPSSVPEHRYSSYPTGQQGTDSYRPSINATRPAAGFGASGTFLSHSSNPFAGGSTGSGAGSPFRSGNSASPAFSTFGSTSGGSWGAQHSRPSTSLGGPTSTFQSFPIRPPSSVSPAQQTPGGGIRLPPLQAHPGDYSTGWSSDYSKWSHSPPS